MPRLFGGRRHLLCHGSQPHGMEQKPSCKQGGHAGHRGGDAHSGHTVGSLLGFPGAEQGMLCPGEQSKSRPAPPLWDLISLAKSKMCTWVFGGFAGVTDGTELHRDTWVQRLRPLSSARRDAELCAGVGGNAATRERILRLRKKEKELRWLKPR